MSNSGFQFEKHNSLTWHCVVCALLFREQGLGRGLKYIKRKTEAVQEFLVAHKLYLLSQMMALFRVNVYSGRAGDEMWDFIILRAPNFLSVHGKSSICFSLVENILYPGNQSVMNGIQKGIADTF